MFSNKLAIFDSSSGIHLSQSKIVWQMSHRSGNFQWYDNISVKQYLFYHHRCRRRSCRCLFHLIPHYTFIFIISFLFSIFDRFMRNSLSLEHYIIICIFYINLHSNARTKHQLNSNLLTIFKEMYQRKLEHKISTNITKLQ